MLYLIVGSIIPSIPYSKVAGLRILFGHAAIHAWQAVQAFLNASIFPAPGGRIGAFPFSDVCFAGIIFFAATAAAKPPIAIRAFLRPLSGVLSDCFEEFFLNHVGTSLTPPLLQDIIQS